MDPLAQIDLVVAGGVVLSAVVTTVGLVVVAKVNGRMAAQLALQQHLWQVEQSEKLTAMATNVQKIEIATNSMKDALVASTAISSDLQGEKRGIEIGRAQAEAAKNS